MCKKTHRYRAKATAERVADALALLLSRPRMVAYWCAECGRWCLTSKLRRPEDLFPSNHEPTP